MGPTMPNIYYKMQQAVETAKSDPEITKRHPGLARMRRETVYAILEARGYAWSTERQCWYVRAEVVMRGGNIPTPAQAVKNVPSVGVFLVRIMAPQGDIDKITAEFYELAEALNWSIERDSREYPNEGDGNWVRKYFTVKRG